MASNNVRDGKTMKPFRCKHCHLCLPTNPHVKNQQYCGSIECQRARKNAWQRNKMATDPDYVDNQQRARQSWQKNNPDYWRTYRQKRQKPPPAASAPKPVKMDAFRPICDDFSGKYLLFPVGSDGHAKMDALLVKIIKVIRCYAHAKKDSIARRPGSSYRNQESGVP